ncbi:MAG TPA: TIGR03936 family radical SAM-associated protein [Propionibacteriaceae bacterium]|nr:TIGR03936 family radical SAM-associated protein [Propionibacteriaceae bacterium]HPZ50184.1 TIGR03936 family radical SAM-associated protein [Propionibacteriaceae bacterium]HQE31421.1 TIGR03936 family radical SAM-associated protein [Propionibacteriaceae bacterium]
MSLVPRQQPEQQAPPVQRLRVRYAKRGRARFTSHRDFCRAFERALRRAQIPMAYSSGFNPHPRISYANASPTGASTEAEYLEIGLAEVCQPERVREALDAALPPGLDVIEVVAAGSPGAASLTDLLEASRWHVDLVTTPAGVLAEAVATFLASPEVSVARMTKTGLRTFDARAAVRSLEVVGEHELEMVTVHGTPLVRPDDIVSALREVDSRLASDQPPLLLRISQGPLVDDQIRDPLASD